uniref:hypothetical protein n=1 Tax=Alicyclobacillus kakegawensis TaxID=392012 RepID=UPI001C3F1713
VMVMNVCPVCQSETVEARLKAGFGLLMIESATDGDSKVSPVTAFVCSKCGHVSLIARHPEYFK